MDAALSGVNAPLVTVLCGAAVAVVAAGLRTVRAVCGSRSEWWWVRGGGQTPVARSLRVISPMSLFAEAPCSRKGS